MDYLRVPLIAFVGWLVYAELTRWVLVGGDGDRAANIVNLVAERRAQPT